MSRFGLEEFMETEEATILKDVEPIQIEDDDTADLVAETASSNIEAAMEELQDYAVATEHLESILFAVAHAKTKTTISKEEFSEFKSKISTAMESMGGDPKKFFPALESATDYRIAIEDAEKQAEGIAARFMSVLSKVFANLRDNLYYLVQFFDWQASRLSKVRAAVQAAPDGKFTVTLPRTLYMCYGDKQSVTSGKEYLAKLKESTEVINVLLKEVGAFTKADIFSSFRNVIFMFGKKNFIKNYNNFAKLLQNVAKSAKFKKVGEIGTSDRMVSEYFLGEFQIGLNVPEGGFKDSDDEKLDTLKKDLRTVTLWVGHRVGLKSGYVKLEDVDKTTLLQVLDEIETLVKGYKTFYSLTMKVSHYGAGALMLQAGKTLSVSVPLAGKLMFTGLLVFVNNYRLIYQASGVILQTTGTVFNIAKGTTKNALRLAERFVSTSAK